MAAITVTSFMYTILDADTSFAYIAAVNAARMLGTAMVLMPVTTAALNELPRSLIPHGTAMNNTMRQVAASMRSEEHTSELQSRGHLVCRLLLEKKKRYMSRQTGD